MSFPSCCILNIYYFSMLTTKLQENRLEMPVCGYQVLLDGPEGPPVTFANVGQQVYHKWSCESHSSKNSQ